MKNIFIAVFLIALTGCANQHVMKMSDNIARIKTSTAPIYGPVEPEKRAFWLAANETVRSGYDKFIILRGQSQFKQNVIGQVPGHVQGSWDNNGGYVQGYGSRTISAPRNETEIVIKMFRAGDPEGRNALDAHAIIKREKI